MIQPARPTSLKLMSLSRVSGGDPGGDGGADDVDRSFPRERG